MSATPRQVRIIGGQWRKSVLPVADKPGLRPTPDRVRETLFNWLGQDLTGWRVLDAFAGSGALGFEAGSRGASEVHMLEQDPQLVASLNATCQRLSAQTVRVERADALSWMRGAARGRFELVMLDPPYAANWSVQAAALAAELLVSDGFLYVESDRLWGASDLPHCEVWRSLRAGLVHATLLRRRAPSSS